MVDGGIHRQPAQPVHAIGSVQIVSEIIGKRDRPGGVGTPILSHRAREEENRKATEVSQATEHRRVLRTHRITQKSIAVSFSLAIASASESIGSFVRFRASGVMGGAFPSGGSTIKDVRLSNSRSYRPRQFLRR